MDSEWLGSAGNRLSGGWASVTAFLYSLAEPHRARQVKILVYCLACLWLVLALARLVWNLLPQPEQPLAVTSIVNPLGGSGAPGNRQAITIDELAGWHLFGTPDKKRPASTAKPEVVVDAAAGEQSADGSGIEDGAKETKLSLQLAGVVASSDADSAVAVIEHDKSQVQYHVGDKMPVSGRVTLAKILPDRVVLNNKGKYELLTLFDDSSLDSQPLASARVEKPPRQVDKRGDRGLTRIAEEYRNRLYKNPQSLADVVNISAVRVQGELQGYRVSAGKDREQFKRLGFKTNDLVTSVNGIELNNPGKAMELYRIMRGATEASFDVRRGEEVLTLVVDLGSEADSE